MRCDAIPKVKTAVGRAISIGSDRWDPECQAPVTVAQWHENAFFALRVKHALTSINSVHSPIARYAPCNCCRGLAIDYLTA